MSMHFFYILFFLGGGFLSVGSQDKTWSFVAMATSAADLAKATQDTLDGMPGMDVSLGLKGGWWGGLEETRDNIITRFPHYKLAAHFLAPAKKTTTHN